MQGIRIVVIISFYFFRFYYVNNICLFIFFGVYYLKIGLFILFLKFCIGRKFEEIFLYIGIYDYQFLYVGFFRIYLLLGNVDFR